MPRPTTSVATRIWTLPSRKCRHHAVAGALRQVAVDAGDVRESFRTSRRWIRSVPRLVRQKTIACSGSSRSSRRTSSSNFRSCVDREVELLDRFDRHVRWARNSASRGRACTLRASRSTGGGTVADNSSVCRDCGQRRQDLLDVGPKADVEHPVGLVEHHRSTSRRNLSVPRAMWSSTRPGVPTTISAPRRSFSICSRIGLPP